MIRKDIHYRLVKRSSISLLIYLHLYYILLHYIYEHYICYINI
jgi:hypothetical protein